MISIVQGNDKFFTMTLKATSGLAYDLTSCKLFATVKSNYTDPDASALIADSSPSGGITISNPTAGIAIWTIHAADTQNMLGVYKYDIQLKTQAGLIHTLVVDDFVVDPKVTIRTT